MIAYLSPAERRKQGYVQRMVRAGARSALPGNAALGDTMDDGRGNVLEWVEYDAAETALTKRIGMPVGFKLTDEGVLTGLVTGDRSDTNFRCTHILTGVPTVANKYILACRVEFCDLQELSLTTNTTVSLTTDGQVEENDGIMWIDDDLVCSTSPAGGSAKYPGIRYTYDMGVALGADSSTALTKGRLQVHAKTPDPDPTKVTFFRVDELTVPDALSQLGDSGFTFALAGLDVTGPTNRKLALTPDTTANDECIAYTLGKAFLFAAGKRVCFRMNMTWVDAATLGGFVAGFGAATIASGTTDLIVDTTGTLCAAAVMKGCAFYALPANLQLHHMSSDGTTQDTNTAENLQTMVSGTEYEVMMRTVGATSMSISSFVNKTAAGVALTLPIAAAAQMSALLYVKGVAGTTSPVLRVRNVEWAIEI